jgi:lysophospholipase L1-like esterase
MPSFESPSPVHAYVTPSELEREFAYQPKQTIGRRLLRKLNEGLEDCSILIVGDSTSATYSTWSGKVFEALAARFPGYTFKYRDWTDGEAAYNAASTKQTGTGSRTITMYNCAVASKNAYYQMAPNFDAMIASVQPDLIFFSHGHNHGDATFTPEPFFRDGITVVTESITRACPLAELVIFAQNPRTDANAEVQAKRQFVVEEIAELRGFGFINVHRLIVEAPGPLTKYINEDGIHPNPTAYTLIANEVLRRLDLNGSLPSQQPSSFTIPSATILSNGAFETFASPPVLTAWTATNTLLEKDTTNFESVSGWSVKMKTEAEGSASFITQNITNNSLRTLRGGWVAFLARVRIPVGQSAYPGQVKIQENNGSHVGSSTSENLAVAGVGQGQGDWRWTMATRRLATDVTNCSFIIICENTAKGEVSVDRAIVARGILPKDIRT